MSKNADIEELVKLLPGIYETLITENVEQLIRDYGADRTYTEGVDAAQLPYKLAQLIRETLEKKLPSLGPQEQISLVNELLSKIGHSGFSATGVPEQLLEISETRLAGAQTPRPESGLSDVVLLTNSNDEPSLGSELQKEISSADGIDLLSAFIRWNGLRVIESQLEEAKQRSVPIRVLTTTYIGATERRALDRLVEKFGATVKVNYETQSTRLHAKAWLFRRNSDLDTAYVGSSNLSHSALVDGLEWNVRLSNRVTPHLVRKFAVTFESYWNDPSFEEYLPDRDAEKLDIALGRSSNYGKEEKNSISGLEVRPFPHQVSMLEALTSEREIRDIHNNLLIAATGTGKTVVAALDYAQLLRTKKKDLTLLFVAHRKEILQQSLRTYREVLIDGNFGELLADGERPTSGRHVFASVQSLHESTLEQFAPDHFDVLVIDEFHHAEAKTYRRILDHFTPIELLGLTATPERADGVDIKKEFFNSRAAAELRLWDALAEDLLVPFHYFGIADNVDLDFLEWKRGYDSLQLEAMYIENNARTLKIITALNDKVIDVHKMHAVGFCVSVKHAEYMAQVFNDHGIPAVAISGKSSGQERRDAITALRQREINCIFAVDIFNEGLDIPAIDTILMLRPTQSSTIFLQQLGRGLRRAPGKAVLTVLDFIGVQHREFRFDTRLRGITGSGRKELAKQVETGFPFVPGGSQIILDRVVQKIVLENIRQQLRGSQKLLIQDIASHYRTNKTNTLASYIAESGTDLSEIYRGTNSWTKLRRLANIHVEELDVNSVTKESEEFILKRISKLTHVDDVERASAYKEIVTGSNFVYSKADKKTQMYARMLTTLIWRDNGDFESYDSAINFLRLHQAACWEIANLMDITSDLSRRLALPISLQGDFYTPVKSHATYRREEILSGLMYSNLEGGRSGGSHREGVAWSDEIQTDILFVTVNKSSKRFAPEVMYRDYGLSETLFHWDSQNATSSRSPVGQRYINHKRLGTNVLLFIRITDVTEEGESSPFVCLGSANFVSHKGENPMGITWELDRPMPADVFLASSTIAH
jgi:superfamily II DNA or RNA helicase/HKD family nuclease